MPSFSCQPHRPFSLSARLGVVVNPRNISISSLPLSVDEMGSQYYKGAVLIIQAYFLGGRDASAEMDGKGEGSETMAMRCVWMRFLHGRDVYEQLFQWRAGTQAVPC